jgi:hypothetical protein
VPHSNQYWLLTKFGQIDVQVIETVLQRLVQLRHLIVKWNPLNPEVAAATVGGNNGGKPVGFSSQSYGVY